ncbi:MAG: hypothetical protein C0P74_014740 [Gammaproteobacteria bacterium]
MSIKATLDADGEESGVLRVPRTKTVSYTVDVTSLVNGEVHLLVSYNNRGSWDVVRRITADSSGQLVNDSAGVIYVKFALVETEASLSGDADVTLALEPQTVVVLRDPATNQPLIEYGDTLIKPIVGLDLSTVPEFTDNAAALAAGAAIGSVYADATGALFRVIEGA